ncbi:MAG: rhomboid family intramembrane serine protease [Lachnospiraceae bacterium]|nr:rhomboid family intramembrane serine protease [Lachnospiraceae bacterium]
MSDENNPATRLPLLSKLGKCPVTVVILAANTVVFLLGFIKGEDFAYDYGIFPPAVRAGEYYRLFTSFFIHADFAHFLCNMFVLFSIGQMFESVLGHIRTAVIYLLSGLGGSAAVMLIEDEYTLTVGASGAIFGMIGALLVFMLRNKRFDLAKNIVIGLAINLAITFTSKTVSVGGHVGGLVSGLVLGLILCMRKRSDQ